MNQASYIKCDAASQSEAVGLSQLTTNPIEKQDHVITRDEREMARLGKRQELRGPTAGGQYHWAFLLAPKSCRNFLSFITGWQSVLFWQACLTGSAFLFGPFVQGLLVLNYPEYVYERWHGTLFSFAQIILAMLFNTYLARFLPSIEGAVLILHVLGCLVILITLFYLAPLGSARYVFVKFNTLGGYDQVTSFFVGLSAPVFAFIGADGAVHMCEEIKDASTVVPQSLMVSVGLNGLLGFLTLLAILFSLGSMEDALNTPTQYPFLEIFRRVTQSEMGANAIAIIVLFLLTFATIACLAAASRVIWAFSRDNGLPGSKYLSRVEPRSRLPIFAISLSVIITMLLGLISIGSSAAFNTITSVLVSGCLFSYCVPMVLLVMNKIMYPATIPYGSFTLGRFGLFCNIFGILWMILVMFFSFFPAVRTGVTPETMNWSALVWGGTTLLGVVLYFGYLRNIYHGPIAERVQNTGTSSHDD